jgi:hypothetical protein
VKGQDPVKFMLAKWRMRGGVESRGLIGREVGAR